MHRHPSVTTTVPVWGVVFESKVETLLLHDAEMNGWSEVLTRREREREVAVTVAEWRT